MQLRQTSTNTGTSPTLCILRMILFKKTQQNIICCPLLLCNASDALVFKYTTADFSEGM